MPKRSFWRQVIEKIEELFLTLLDTGIHWIKSTIKWIEGLVGELAKKIRIYITFLAALVFGVLLCVFQDLCPMTEMKRTIFLYAGIILSVSSVIMILRQATVTVLNSFGLLRPIRKLRDRVLGYLKLL